MARLDGPPTPHTKLDRYQRAAPLGRGGFGYSHAGVEQKTGRELVLTTVPVPDATQRNLVLSRIALLEALGSPVLPTVLDVVELDGGFLELVEPRTRWPRLDQVTPLSVDDVRRGFRDMASALDLVHGAGWVHRNIQPQHVYWGDRAHLHDFDYAIPLSAAGPSVVGTPGFLAPELYAGHDPSPQSDQYAFAMTLYAALCSPAGAAPALPLAAQGTVPDAVLEVLRRGTADDPTQRFQDCRTLWEALAAACGQAPNWTDEPAGHVLDVLVKPPQDVARCRQLRRIETHLNADEDFGILAIGLCAVLERRLERRLRPLLTTHLDDLGRRLQPDARRSRDWQTALRVATHRRPASLGAWISVCRMITEVLEAPDGRAWLAQHVGTYVASTWLTRPTLRSVDQIRRRYRNPAAHGERLALAGYRELAQLLFLQPDLRSWLALPCHEARTLEINGDGTSANVLGSCLLAWS